jgi:hypothetical protein
MPMINALQPTLRRLTIKKCGMGSIFGGWEDLITHLCVFRFNLEVFTMDEIWLGGWTQVGFPIINARHRVVLWADPGEPPRADDPRVIELPNLLEQIDAAVPDVFAFIRGVFARHHLGPVLDVRNLSFKVDGDQL